MFRLSIIEPEFEEVTLGGEFCNVTFKTGLVASFVEIFADISGPSRNQKQVQSVGRALHYVLPSSPEPDIAAEIQQGVVKIRLLAALVLRQFQLSLRIMCLSLTHLSTHGLLCGNV